MFDKIKEIIENFLFMRKYNVINEIILLRKDIATIVQASLERQDDINTLMNTYTENHKDIIGVLKDIYSNTKYYSDEIPDIIDKLESIENTVSQPKVVKRNLKKKTLDE